MKKINRNSIVNCSTGLSKKQNLAFIEIEIFNKVTGSTKLLQMSDWQLIIFMFFISFSITLSTDIIFRVLSYFKTVFLDEQREDKKSIDKEDDSFDLVILKGLKKKYFFLVFFILIFMKLLICKEKNLPLYMDIRLRNQLISFTRFSENKFLNHLAFSGLSAFSILFGIILVTPPVQFSFLVRYASYIRTLTLFITFISILICTMRGVNGKDYIKKVASNDQEFTRRFLSDRITVKKKKDEAKNKFLLSENLAKLQEEILELEAETLILEENAAKIQLEALRLEEETLILEENQRDLIDRGFSMGSSERKEKALKIQEENFKIQEEILKLKKEDKLRQEKASKLKEENLKLQAKSKDFFEESIMMVPPRKSNKKAQVKQEPNGRAEDFIKQMSPIKTSPVRPQPPRN